MKKINILLFFALLPTFWLRAQEPAENIAQPQNCIGRRINSSGEVTREYNASFSYAPDGKLDRFQSSEWGVSSSYAYEDDFLTTVRTRHEGTWPFYSDVLSYTYEDGRIKLESHLWEYMNANEYVEYTYYEDGRLARKDYATYHPEDVYGCSVFEYLNGGKTRRETYSAQSFQGTSPVVGPKYRITCQYDDRYSLLSEQKDQYDASGEVTNSTRVTYTYNAYGRLETEVSQTLDGKGWVNNSIHKYLYDGSGKVAEQQDGTWSAATADWNITKKAIHEYSSDGMIYTVSFYKKSGDDWVRDIFNYQRLFFAPELKRQQEALNCFAYEDLLGSAQINQFEFELIHTKKPTYHSVTKTGQPQFNVYPNPGKGDITISAPVENCVVRFYDIQGRMMLAMPIDFNATISTGNWTPGVYVWEIWNGTYKEASGKWVKE